MVKKTWIRHRLLQTNLSLGSYLSLLSGLRTPASVFNCDRNKKFTWSESRPVSSRSGIGHQRNIFVHNFRDLRCLYMALKFLLFLSFQRENSNKKTSMWKAGAEKPCCQLAFPLCHLKPHAMSQMKASRSSTDKTNPPEAWVTMIIC